MRLRWIVATSLITALTLAGCGGVWTDGGDSGSSGGSTTEDETTGDSDGDSSDSDSSDGNSTDSCTNAEDCAYYACYCEDGAVNSRLCENGQCRGPDAHCSSACADLNSGEWTGEAELLDDSSGDDTSDDDTSDDDSSNDSTDPVAACNDIADAVAAAAQRCGDDYQQARDQFLADAVGGDCANVVEVRNASTLYDDCIPWWDNLTCPEYDSLTTADVPASCQNQLLVE